MIVVPYLHVRDLWAELVGENVDNLGAAEKLTFNRLFNRAIRRGWEWYFWPELMLLEERTYRYLWTAGTYSALSEIYHDTTDAYWRANSLAGATEVPGVSALWDLISDLDAYIGYDQTGKTPLGGVKAVWNGNFRTSRATKINFTLDERGVTLTAAEVPKSAWIHFRKRCPVFRGADYDAAIAYASGVTRYYSSSTAGFEGDYWTTSAATNAGENPETAAAKWTKLGIPTFLCDFAANAAKIGYLEGDDQLDKALANEQSTLWQNLYDEMDKFEGQSGQVRQARVANI